MRGAGGAGVVVKSQMFVLRVLCVPGYKLFNGV